MPKMKKAIVVYKRGVLKMYEKMAAPIIVSITSTIAILKTLYECIPFLGIPNKSLYLHKFIAITYANI